MTTDDKRQARLDDVNAAISKWDGDVIILLEEREQLIKELGNADSSTADVSLREHLTLVLDVLEEATVNELKEMEKGPKARLRLKEDKKAKGQTRWIPVVQNGKHIRCDCERVPDYRLAAERGFLRSIRELRLALSNADDTYRIAWLALSVGATTTLHDAMMGRSLRSRGPVMKAAQKEQNEPRDAKIYAEVNRLMSPESSERLSAARQTYRLELALKAEREKAKLENLKLGNAKLGNANPPKVKGLSKPNALKTVASEHNLSLRQVRRIYSKQSKPPESR